jgi:prepilin-type N-terminal cleavage/methylation domain-containing protein
MLLPALDNPTRIRRASPRGFTLVELLVVLIIIAILGSAVMFAMFSAQESARAAKTKSTISKLNALIMQRYESYIDRRVPIVRIAGEKPQVFHGRRLQALRELMRMEMPDRHHDVLDDQVTKMRRPAVSHTYRRRIDPAKNHPQFFANQGAECLYLIIAHGTEDSDAIAHFSQSDLGDFDGDGLPEFLDGWGRPISWLRWPAGFQSPRQVLDYTQAYDQFDPFQTQTRPPTGSQPTSNNERAYALFPLIYSGGPDRSTDIWADDASTGGKRLQYAHPAVNHNPYVVWKLKKIGTPFDDDGDGQNFGDNIHNHDLSIR